MSGRPGGRGGGGRTLLPPINLIFKMLTSGQTVTVWLFENTDSRVEGKVKGFDEYMNIVLGDAFEIRHNVKEKSDQRFDLGEIMLKGDNISVLEVQFPPS